MIVAVDTGGTKTLVAGFEKDGSVLKQFRFPTPINTDEYVRVLKQVLSDNFSDQKVEVISIGLAGIVEDGVAIWCNNLKWENFDLKSALSGVLNNAPIVIDNDANLAGLSAARHLGDDMPKSLLYVTIGTGIGSSIISGGRIDTNFRHSEAGRSLVEYGGKVLEWESFASGKAIYRDFGQYARDIVDPKIWYEVANRISRGFLALIPALQPTTILIGGGIGAHFDKYRDNLVEILTESLPPHIPVPNILAAEHPEHAVIHGCYFYATDYLNT